MSLCDKCQCEAETLLCFNHSQETKLAQLEAALKELIFMQLEVDRGNGRWLLRARKVAHDFDISLEEKNDDGTPYMVAWPAR